MENDEPRLTRWQLVGDEVASYEDEQQARSREAIELAEQLVVEIVTQHTDEKPSPTRILELAVRQNPMLSQSVAALAIQRLVRNDVLVLADDATIALGKSVPG